MAGREALFADIDTMEPDRFAAHLADDVVMRFGNGEAIHGRPAAREAWASFCRLVDGVHHELLEQWEVGEATIAQTDVTYTRKDGERVTVPVVTIYRAAGDLIDDYRVYIDLAPVFAPAA